MAAAHLQTNKPGQNEMNSLLTSELSRVGINRLLSFSWIYAGCEVELLFELIYEKQLYLFCVPMELHGFLKIPVTFLSISYFKTK